MKTPRDRRRSKPVKAERTARRADARAIKEQATIEYLHRQVDGPGRMTSDGWMCMSFEPVRLAIPDWQDDEADTRPAERIDTRSARRGRETAPPKADA